MSNRTLEILIKRDRLVLDEKRQVLAALQREQDALQAKIDQLIALRREEQEAMQGDLNYIQELSRFMEYSAQQLKTLETEQQALSLQVDAATEAVREAYSTVSKMEIALDGRIENEKQEQQKKQQTMIDEVAGMADQRRNR